MKEMQILNLWSKQGRTRDYWEVDWEKEKGGVPTRMGEDSLLSPDGQAQDSEARNRTGRSRGGRRFVGPRKNQGMGAVVGGTHRAGVPQGEAPRLSMGSSGDLSSGEDESRGGRSEPRKP